MRSHLCAFVCTAAALLTAHAAAADIDTILTYRTLSDVKLSPNGRYAAFVATHADIDENVMNSDVWLVDLASERSFQLTRGAKSDNAPRFSPDGKQIAFLSDRGEKTNVWLIAPDGGEAEPATKFEKMSVAAFAWLPDGSGFIFTAVDPPTEEEEKLKKEKNDPKVIDSNPKFARLYRFNLGDEEPQKLTAEDYHVTSFDIAPDGDRIVFSEQPSSKAPDAYNSDLKLLDLESGEIEDLVTRDGRDSSPRFSPDGRQIAFVSGGGRVDWIGNTFLTVIDVEGGEPRTVSESFDERVGAPLRWSPDGETIYFPAAQRVAQRVMRADVDTGAVEAATEHDAEHAARGFALSDDGESLALLRSDPTTPSELYQVRLEDDDLDKLTTVNRDFADTAPPTEVLRYKSQDGLDIEALVVKPKDFDEATRYPLLVVVHGGPSGVFSLGFSPRRGAYPLHAFTDQGYVVLMVNPRGSGGYGERFRRANYRDWGYGDYRDITDAVDLLVRRGTADPERMGIMGWSYGGYITSWTITQTSRFKAASVGAGVTNVYSLYGTTDISDFAEAHFGGRPWEDPQVFLRHSAVNFAHQVETPTLIQHGGEDRRVPLAQGEELYTALKKSGVEVQMVVYPRQPHGIREPKLIRDSLQRNLDWFNRYLLGIEPEDEEAEEDENP